MARLPLSEFGASTDWEAEAAWLAPLVALGVAFIDRIVIWVRRPMSTGVQAILRQHAALVFPDREHRPKGRGYAETWVILRPSLQGLRLLHRCLMARRGYLLVSVEIALDLIVRSAKTKRRLDHFIDTCWTHLRPPNSSPDSGGGACYSAAKFLARDVVDRDTGEVSTGYVHTRKRHAYYSDKPSKATGYPHVVHLELRIQTPAACRSPSVGVGSLLDLINFDFAKFWTKHLTLRAIDPAALARSVRQERRRGRPPHGSNARDTADGRRLMGISRLCAGPGYSSANVGVNVVKRYMRLRYPDARLDRVMIRIPAAAFLPDARVIFQYEGGRLVSLYLSPIISTPHNQPTSHGDEP